MPVHESFSLSPMETQKLRSAHYNAEVAEIRRIHDDLAILRVLPDAGRVSFTPGQYTVLGLGYWEPRISGAQEESLTEDQRRRVVQRAYSICCSMLDATGQLVRPTETDALEFYVSIVRRAEKHAPALTPRLFALAKGDRLVVGARAHGHYTLHGVRPDDDVIFVATGTGEAPHNAMLAELLASGHRGRIVSVTCVRYERDLAYLATHRRLEQMFPQYRYLCLTTREPRNLDVARPDYVGKSYLQEFFASGRFEETWGCSIDAARTRVFLCGSPAMIGAPQHSHALRFYPQPTGMVEVLEGRGLKLEEGNNSGGIRVERYW